MKRIMIHIRVLLLLPLLVGSLPSCTGETPQEEENVNVTFAATLQDGMDGRSLEELNVNTLVVGIYGEMDEKKVELFRDTCSISSGSVDVQLALGKGKAYHFIFWAYNNASSIYDATNLQSISMNAGNIPASWEEAEKADAFFATVEHYQVTASRMQEVTLVRPLARINVGTSGKAEAASFKVGKAPVTFHPFTKEVSGEADLLWSFSETIDERFTIMEQEYTYLAVAYMFAPSQAAVKKACALKLGTAEEIPFSVVELQANHRTNIVGSFTKEE